ncbi:MAG: 16S rRNA (uracil(1498)-N(3))-methyltransferase [Anaerolineae bacterium]|nr:16S rRNA (uracil(1498)-N(3))-methyltransferase [Anaerolineae bacterium]
MHRFFVEPAGITHRAVHFDGDQAHQMRRVLRLRRGDRVLVLDGRGRQTEVILDEVANARVTGQVGEWVAATGEPRARLTLFQSLLRREKFEWVLQKGTELGVAHFVPVITRRSLVRDLEDVTPEKLGRWRRIVKEAAEQCGRGLLPELAPPLAFPDALREAVDADVALIAWEGPVTRTIADALRPDAASVALFIGPEGGYDAEEVDEAIAAGCVAVTLGGRTLRTETAAVVGATLVLHALGELG